MSRGDNRIDLTGRRFGRWLVRSRASSDTRGNLSWHCRCDCGRTRTVRGDHLRSGVTGSCGCAPRAKRGGESRVARAAKMRARSAVNHAIRDGRIKRLPCARCGRTPTEAHHYLGYEPEHWLDVIFLCGPHHTEADNQPKSPAASPASTVHSTARDGAVHIIWKDGKHMIEIKESQGVEGWPEPEGSYYSRQWRGYVEVFGFQYGVYDAKWVRIARITSVEQGQAYVAEHVFDASYRIVDVGGNVYESGLATGSPASA